MPARAPAQRHYPRRDRLGRREHRRSDQAQPGRYRVEAVTAGRNAAALAQLARELGARVRRRCRSGSLRCTERRAVPAAASKPPPGEAALVEAARASGRLGHGGDCRRGRSQADARGRSSAARRSRSPTRNAWSAPAPLFMRARRGGRRDGAAGRFRAQRAVPGARRRPARGRHAVSS